MHTNKMSIAYTCLVAVLFFNNAAHCRYKCYHNDESLLILPNAKYSELQSLNRKKKILFLSEREAIP